MKTAVVHDWLVVYAGAERPLEQILGLFPEAELFSMIDFLDDADRGFVRGKRATTSFIQKLPFAKKKYRGYLPLMPLAVEQLDLSGFDLVLSSSYAVSKGVITGPNQLHICYCCSPMRYAWDLYHDYMRESGLDRGIKGAFAKLLMHYIRLWDHSASSRVDHYIAISNYIARRIKKIYGRESTVIYPPVYTDEFELCTEKEDYYLTVSRMVPYKKMDMIVEAFSAMPDKKLIVIGDGPDFEKVKAKAGRNVELLGALPNAELREYMKKAAAFVFAAEEDFGIVPIEAQACGTPVIAYGRGGILETVVEGQTGIFFENQTPKDVADAVRRFEKRRDDFDYNIIRKNAERFAKERFRQEYSEFVTKKLDEFRTCGKMRCD